MYRITRLLCLLICILRPEKATLQPDLQLSTPFLSHHATMIGSDIPILKADFRMEGVTLRYTSDGSKPGPTSPILRNSLPVRFPCTVKVAAFHPDFLPSEPAEASFYLPGKPIQSCTATLPHEKYRKGIALLTDKQFGTLQFSEHYLGYSGDTVQVELQTVPWQVTKSIHLSGLSHPGAWIMPPLAVVVKNKEGKVIARHTAEPPARDATTGKWHVILPVEPDKYRVIILTIPPSPLPAWHPGASSPSWLFLDEVWIE